MICHEKWSVIERKKINTISLRETPKMVNTKLKVSDRVICKPKIRMNTLLPN